jgi:hypothetical protein
MPGISLGCRCARPAMNPPPAAAINAATVAVVKAARLISAP